MDANLEKGTKVCSHCKQEKPLSEFYTSSNTKDGYRPQCKECSKQSSKDSAGRLKLKRNLTLKDDSITTPKHVRKLTVGEKKSLIESFRSDKPLSAYHPRELFEYLASIGYKIKAEYTQTLNFG